MLKLNSINTSQANTASFMRFSLGMLGGGKELLKGHVWWGRRCFSLKGWMCVNGAWNHPKTGFRCHFLKEYLCAALCRCHVNEYLSVCLLALHIWMCTCMLSVYSGWMKRIVSHLFRLRVSQLLIWPLKTSVTSDHCCFVMLHSRPRGSKTAQGLPFISARVL